MTILENGCLLIAGNGMLVQLRLMIDVIFRLDKVLKFFNSHVQAQMPALFVRDDALFGDAGIHEPFRRLVEA